MCWGGGVGCRTNRISNADHAEFFAQSSSFPFTELDEVRYFVRTVCELMRLKSEICEVVKMQLETLRALAVFLDGLEMIEMGDEKNVANAGALLLVLLPGAEEVVAMVVEEDKFTFRQNCLVLAEPVT